MIGRLLSKLLIKFLLAPSSSLYSGPTHTTQDLINTLRPGDILLVEGNQRFSLFIKYLTQSNWSHVAMYIGNGRLVEADLVEGVRDIPVEEYANYHTRICRPVNLIKRDLDAVIKFCMDRMGLKYDLKNVFDLARYLIPLPFIPNKYKRDILELGAGDPTKVICSSLIAEAFHQVKYPIIPNVIANQKKTFFKRRHHTLFTPADFDRSPYFEIIKPTLAMGFNYVGFDWQKKVGTES